MLILVVFPVYILSVNHNLLPWQALAALGLKSGGTIQQRAERLFLTKVALFFHYGIWEIKIQNLNMCSVILCFNILVRPLISGGRGNFTFCFILMLHIDTSQLHMLI